MPIERISRRTVLKAVPVATAATLGFPAILKAADVVKIGLIAPLTGLAAVSGIDMMQGAKLALDEINKSGAAGGRQFSLLVEDNKLDPKAAIDASRKLIYDDHVDAIIGVLNSPDRVAVLTVTEPAEQLFIYPTFYEGGECNHKYFFATGSVPNQSVDPVVPWLIKNVGKRIYVLANDFLYPRGMAALIKTAAEREGGSYVGEEFYPFGTAEYGAIFSRAKEAKPDVIWVMDAGQPTMILQYRQFDMKPQIISSILNENMTLKTNGVAEGVLGNASYFASVDTASNKKFLPAYRATFKGDLYPSNFGEAQYNSMWLYALAVAKAGSTDKDKVSKALIEVAFEAPQGRVNIVGANHHSRLNSIIGRVNKSGLIDVVQEFGPIDPTVPGCSMT